MFVSLVLTFVGCKSSQTNDSENTGTVLVQLYKAESVEKLENSFTAYNLSSKKVVSRPTNIFLFTFNKEKITDTELITKLKASELVKEAQQNRDLQIRNTN